MSHCYKIFEPCHIAKRFPASVTEYLGSYFQKKKIVIFFCFLNFPFSRFNFLTKFIQKLFRSWLLTQTGHGKNAWKSWNQQMFGALAWMLITQKTQTHNVWFIPFWIWFVPCPPQERGDDQTEDEFNDTMCGPWCEHKCVSGMKHFHSSHPF